MAQLTFSRKEKKYLMQEAQYQCLLESISPHLLPDRYSHYTICNTYYDTVSFDLIRRSIEKTDAPKYKEKLRLRSYGAVGAEDRVFLELKKKYRGVVYKRRLTLPYAQAKEALQPVCELAPLMSVLSLSEQQILREVRAFCDLHHPRPVLYLAYDREAYSAKEDPQLRITFDRRIRYRWEDVELKEEGSRLLLEEDAVLLELKMPYAMPLWLVRGLERAKLYPVSFSKYGEIYKKRLQESFCAPNLSNVAEPLWSQQENCLTEGVYLS